MGLSLVPPPLPHLSHLSVLPTRLLLTQKHGHQLMVPNGSKKILNLTSKSLKVKPKSEWMPKLMNLCQKLNLPESQTKSSLLQNTIGNVTPCISRDRFLNR